MRSRYSCEDTDIIRCSTSYVLSNVPYTPSRIGRAIRAVDGISCRKTRRVKDSKTPSLTDLQAAK